MNMHSNSQVMSTVLVGLIFSTIAALILTNLTADWIWQLLGPQNCLIEIGKVAINMPFFGPLSQILKLTDFKAGLFTLIFIVIIVLFIVCFVLVIKRSAPPLDDQYSSGPKLLENKHAIKYLRKWLKAQSIPDGMLIHPLIQLTAKLENTNIFVFGMQGAGKSTLIKQWLLDIFKSKSDRCFIYDQKGEYQALLPKSNVVSITADDSSNYFWDIGQDVLCCDDAELVAESMIESYNNSNDFFTVSARQVLIGVFFHLIKCSKPWSWSEVAKVLFCDDGDLQNILEAAYLPASKLIVPDSKSTQSIRSVITSQLGWIATMTQIKGQIPWSVNGWLNQNIYPSHVLFKPSPKRPAKSRSMVNALMSVITQLKLSAPDNEKEKTWLVIDELGNLPKSPSLESWLSLSRSKGGRMIAGTQNLSQISQQYDNADSIFSLFGIIVAMRLGPSGISAENAAKSMGNYIARTTSQTVSTDESKTENLQERAVITKEDIIHLPLANKLGVEGFLLIGGSNAVCRLKWPFPKTRIAEPDLAPSIQNTSEHTEISTKVLVQQNRLNRRRKKQTSKEIKS